MSLYLKIILVICGLAYLISPMDLLPELFIPLLGWIDDSLIIGVLYYLLRYNRLPDVAFLKNFNRRGKWKKEDNFNRRYRQNSSSADGSENSNNFRSPSPGSRKNRVKPPHEILGVKSDASKSEIKQAYKEAVKKYHPDKLSHLGEEFAHLANEKFLELQKAYDTLMKQ
ncbi:MAG: DnaJ domain-containing protein [Desulfobacterales bacterium]|nr:DnaJ domain-containing protein [Desulfobacterales bacterium]